MSDAAQRAITQLTRRLLEAQTPEATPDPRDAVVAAARAYLAGWDDPVTVSGDALHERLDRLRDALKGLGR